MMSFLQSALKEQQNRKYGLVVGITLMYPNENNNKKQLTTMYKKIFLVRIRPAHDTIQWPR